MNPRHIASRLLIAVSIIILAFSGCTAADPFPAGSTAGLSSSPETTGGLITEGTLNESMASGTEPLRETALIAIECINAVNAGISGLPSDGIILNSREAIVFEGDSVWDILSRVCDEEGIALAKTGSGKSVLVTGIAGLTPVSAKSGWIYSVNGTVPMIGSSSYTVRAGDVIAWHYTMDSGKDVGSDGGQ